MHQNFMQRAIDLAKRGSGFVNPNPMVGAVIVKNERIIGEGYHAHFGELHAERNALDRATEDVSGATMYVTLEPCCHFGKTAPCTEAIIASGISTVYIGSLDVNVKVAGQGVKQLEAAGITVHVGLMREACQRLNKFFNYFITTNRPFVTMKYAMTMDGKIATSANHSQWVTGRQARQHVHTQRHAHAAIMVGVNTVRHDDPELTARFEGAHQPIRIICDSQLSVPLQANVIQTADQVPTYLATTCTDRVAHHMYEAHGVKVIVVKPSRNGIDLTDLLYKLGKLGIDSVYVEGGAAIHGSLLENNLINQVHTYIAPKLIGGDTAKTPIGGEGMMKMMNALPLRMSHIEQLGSDLFIESE